MAQAKAVFQNYLLSCEFWDLSKLSNSMWSKGSNTLPPFSILVSFFGVSVASFVVCGWTDDPADNLLLFSHLWRRWLEDILEWFFLPRPRPWHWGQNLWRLCPPGHLKPIKLLLKYPCSENQSISARNFNVMDLSLSPPPSSQGRIRNLVSSSRRESRSSAQAPLPIVSSSWVRSVVSCQWSVEVDFPSFRFVAFLII